MHVSGLKCVGLGVTVVTWKLYFLHKKCWYFMSRNISRHYAVRTLTTAWPTILLSIPWYNNRNKSRKRGFRLVLYKKVLAMVGQWFRAGHRPTQDSAIDSRYIAIIYNTMIHTVQHVQCKTSVNHCIHERHPIPHPYGRAMGCLSSVIEQENDRDISKAHCK